MMLIEAMSEDRSFGRPWNFGPLNRNHAAVLPLAQDFADAWGKDAVLEISTTEQDWKEAASLNLDCSQTLAVLKWRPALDLETTAKWTANWYSRSYQNSSIDNLRKITLEQIKTYEQLQRRST
jgi:nucleoside-diphosphate-sugar epimerase